VPPRISFAGTEIVRWAKSELTYPRRVVSAIRLTAAGKPLLDFLTLRLLVLFPQREVRNAQQMFPTILVAPAQHFARTSDDHLHGGSLKCS